MRGLFPLLHFLLYGLLVLVIVGCASSGSSPHSSSPLMLSYEADVSRGVHSLEMTLRVPAFAGRRLWIDPDLVPFVLNPMSETPDGWIPLERDPQAETWRVSGPPESVRIVRWEFDLQGAASRFRRIRVAKSHGDSCVVSSPSAWLLRPVGLSSEDLLSLTVRTPPGTSFATGIFPTELSDRYVFSAEHISRLPYSVLGSFRQRTLQVGQSQLVVIRLPGPLAVSDEDLLQWVQTRAESVAAYYGRFPVPRALVVLAPGAGGIGSASGNGGAAIYFPLQRRTLMEQLEKDWVLVHEMIHLALPQIPTKHSWLDEGLATYVEPLARYRKGLISKEEVWSDLLWGLPKGLPKTGDQGLDHTPTWGRTYWGGALFCLLAEIEIRRQTQNQMGLEHALRGILSEGGNISVTWPLARVLQAGDRTVGRSVLLNLYRKMKDQPHPVDLDGLWQDLGIYQRGGRIVYDPEAPLAAIREGIL